MIFLIKVITYIILAVLVTTIIPKIIMGNPKSCSDVDIPHSKYAHLFPACIRSNPSLILSNPMLWVINSSTISSFFRYLSTSIGTESLLLYPPNAVPFHTRPVTSWNGLVAISVPAGATPIITDTPQPLCADSRAALCQYTHTKSIHLHQHLFPPVEGRSKTSFTHWLR